MDTSNTMDFYSALRLAYAGKRIFKLEWLTSDCSVSSYWGQMHEGHLRLHKPDGLFHDWIVNDGDMAGIDWVMLPDQTGAVPLTA